MTKNNEEIQDLKEQLSLKNDQIGTWKSDYKELDQKYKTKLFEIAKLSKAKDLLKSDHIIVNGHEMAS